MHSYPIPHNTVEAAIRMQEKLDASVDLDSPRSTGTVFLIARNLRAYLSVFKALKHSSVCCASRCYLSCHATLPRTPNGTKRPRRRRF